MDEDIVCGACGKPDAECLCAADPQANWVERAAKLMAEIEARSREDARNASPQERAEYARGWKNDPAFDSFGLIPDQFCCRGECCGAGSWCCARAGKHSHE